MVKKRLLTSLLISTLALTTGASAVLANVPPEIEVVNEESTVENWEGISFGELADEKNLEHQDILSQLYIIGNDKALIIYSNTINPMVEITIGDNEYKSDDANDELDIVIPLSELKNLDSIAQIHIHKEDSSIISLEYNLHQLTSLYNEQSAQNVIDENEGMSEDEAVDSDSEDDELSLESTDDNNNPNEKELVEDEIDIIESALGEKENENILEEKSDKVIDIHINSSAKISELKPEYISNGYRVNYTTVVGATGFSVDTLPWGTPGYKRVGKTTQLLNQEVTVRQETRNGEYVLIEHDNTLFGWVDKRALRQPQIGHLKRSKSTSFKVKIAFGGYSVDSLPWGTPGYQRLTKTSNYINQEVNVIRQTNNKEYYLLENNKGNLIGWVDHRALTPSADKINNGVDVNYQTTVGVGGFTIDSLPWGTTGHKRIGNTKDYENTSVNVIQETKNGEYVLIQSEDIVIGWVDRRSLRMPQTGNPRHSNKVYYDAEVTGSSFTLDSLPWGTAGYQRLDSSASYLGKEVKVVRATKSGNYLLIEKDNQLLGWIDHRAIKAKHEIGMVPNASPVEYRTTLSKGGYSVDTLPWGVEGYQRVKWSHQYSDKNVEVSYEFGSYALIEQNGLSLGWVDKKALSHIPLVNRHRGHSVNYTAQLKAGYSIDTLPWGVKGFERISKSDFYNGDKVSVIRHSGSYALVEVAGGLVGWVDRKALQVPVIFLDPGHGGTDPGAHGWLNGEKILEKDLNLSISFKIRDRLEDNGYKVLMSREKDTTISRLDRARMANNSDASIFISIHHNAMPVGNESVNGIETIFYSPNPSHPTKINKDMHLDPDRLLNSEKLAHNVQDSLIDSTNAKYRRVFSGAYEVVRETTMPGIIPEFGFMTNQNELKRITTSSYQELLVRGLVSGVNRYFNK